MSQIAVGAVIDNYKITAILGRGGMGIVYKAEDISLERTVALKMMDERLAFDEALLQRFKSEAKALARIDDRHIVKVHALRETPQGFCLVMEYVDGETLEHRIKQEGPLTYAEAASVFRQILTGLGNAHKLGIIHRDLKPSNIMIAQDGVAKIADFGLAKIQRPSDPSKTMAVAGTVQYMSPEQITGLGNVDKRGDLYSLGMTLYEAVAGSLPFTASDSDFAIQMMIVEGKIPPASSVKPELPRELVKVITKATAKDPARRYQSAEEMLAALDQAIPQQRSDSTVTVVASRPPAGRAPRARLPVPFIAGGAGVLLLIAVAIWLFSSGGGTSLSVTTEPPGAAITLNGKSLGTTPLSARSVDPGRLSVRARLEGYAPSETTMVLSEGEELRLTMFMEPIPVTEGTVTFVSVPEGARVLVDGNFLGSTPLRDRALLAGDRHVRIEKDAYSAVDTTVRVAAGRDEQVSFTLAPSSRGSGGARVSIAVQPPGARVEVDGRRVDAEALRDLELDPGRHRVRISAYGYKPETFEFRVGAGERVPLSYTLSPAEREATLVITSKPEGADVAVDNQIVGSTPYQGKVKVGARRIRLDHPVYKRWQRDITLKAAETSEIFVDFTRTFRARVIAIDELGDPVRAAEILVDGQPLSAFTPSEITLSVGLRTIEVRKSGYQPGRLQRNFDGLSTEPLRITMKKQL